MVVDPELNNVNKRGYMLECQHKILMHMQSLMSAVRAFGYSGWKMIVVCECPVCSIILD